MPQGIPAGMLRDENLPGTKLGFVNPVGVYLIMTPSE
jgi:hypothetical protein